MLQPVIVDAPAQHMDIEQAQRGCLIVDAGNDLQHAGQFRPLLLEIEILRGLAVGQDGVQQIRGVAGRSTCLCRGTVRQCHVQRADDIRAGDAGGSHQKRVARSVEQALRDFQRETVFAVADHGAQQVAAEHVGRRGIEHRVVFDQLYLQTLDIA
jgi:hypothetical protein